VKCEGRRSERVVAVILRLRNCMEITRLLTETDRRVAGDSVSGAAKKRNRSKQRKTERRRKKCRELIHFSCLGFLL